MKNEIEDLINEKFSSIDTSLEEIYENNISENIERQVNTQNDSIQKENHRQELLKQLKSLKEMRCDIDYNESMSAEELESILYSVRI